VIPCTRPLPKSGKERGTPGLRVDRLRPTLYSLLVSGGPVRLCKFFRDRIHSLATAAVFLAERQ
jgi:hypothetical protein